MEEKMYQNIYSIDITRINLYCLLMTSPASGARYCWLIYLQKFIYVRFNSRRGQPIGLQYIIYMHNKRSICKYSIPRRDIDKKGQNKQPFSRNNRRSIRHTIVAIKTRARAYVLHYVRCLYKISIIITYCSWEQPRWAFFPILALKGKGKGAYL
jgi:hypothetical protein